ncbi:MAG: hydroxymethylpyrimidine/phosphomethylpyrimidine kinase [Gammaproteobacteria bacterium]|nr:hydroxymethylpyrimidine/phosphomethylpyrimidine kinase [Gammaproteobacteria bacterium]
MSDTNSLPVVMCFSGLDSTGGAGIQADIEAIISMGAHPAPIVTALTVQDTTGLSRYQATDALLSMEQARAVLEDMPVQVIKIGMLGSIEQIQMLEVLLTDYPEIPVILDPVLSAGGGGSLLETDGEDALCELLLPLTTLITPNTDEARILAPEADTIDACAQELMAYGSEYVLITGSHEATQHVENRLYSNQRLMEIFSWERLPHTYHGSGCTLASSIAGLLANGLEPFTAINEAQEYTWQSLQHAYRIGMGQLIPNRLYWAREEEEEGK